MRTLPLTRTLFLLVTVTFSAAAGSPAQTLPLDELIAQAMEGPALRAARARIERARAGEALAVAPRRLQAGLEARAWQYASTVGFVLPATLAGPLGGASMGVPIADRRAESIALVADQLLWDAGRSAAALRAARRESRAARLEQAAVRRAVRWQVLAAATAWQQALATRQAAEATVRSRQALVEQVEAFVRHQQVPRADRLQAQAAAAEARHRLAGARAQVAAARARLAALVGRPIPEGARPGWPELPALPEGDATALAAEALERRPVARAFQARARAAADSAQVARRSRRPELHAQFTASRNDDALLLHQANAQVTVALRWPLLTGGRAAAAARQAEAVRTEMEALAEQARRRIVQEVQQTLAEDAAAAARLEAARAALRAAEQALEVARSRYREGLISGRELLDAEADATRAREMDAVAGSTRIAARIAARLALGLPTTDSEGRITP
ncbi:MAG: TolC family protein [Acidobacteriota bacterium]|nr:TolC family protein [Acidobacteriota bacterium]MDQ7088805.1 TolC family protein [Acidobacteriota bacterium]